MANDPLVRILIADHHAMFRAALRALIESEPNFRVVGEAADGADAVKLAPELHPDVLLLDLAMPRLSGLEVLRALQLPTGSCRTMVLAASIKEAERLEALRIGACGIMLKASPGSLLFQGIRAVVAGEYWVDSRRMADPGQFLRSPRTGRSSKRPRSFGLTRRELQVVSAVVAGYSNREIAQHLSITRDTTKHHVSNIFDKLGVSNRLELALFACHHRLVDDSFGVHPVDHDARGTDREPEIDRALSTSSRHRRAG